MEEETENFTGLESIQHRHKAEKKDLQAKIQKLKHSVPKGDKKRKKVVTEEISQLQTELDLKHANELKELENNGKEVASIPEALAEAANDDVQDVPAVKKVSKAQKRREKREQAEKDRILREAEADKEAETGPRRVEIAKITQLLRDKDLQIYDVPSNGDCLYSALAHQSSGYTVAELRQLTVTHMKENSEDFMPFLSGEDGDGLTSEGFEKYCNETLRNAWGGQLELRAIAAELKQPIEVVQADGPAVLIGEEFAGDKITVTYHRHYYGLGEHYNSVEPFVPEEEDDL